MTRIGSLLVLLALTSSAARADQLGATRRMPLKETSHTVDIRIENGVATYTVQRVFSNPGAVADQVELQIGLPYGATATGLRIKAKDRWYSGELMDRDKAAALYEEMTGFGSFTAKDPALLAWMWADTLALQIFPVMPKAVSTVEYTLTAPTRYENGRYVVSYPRVASATTEDGSLPLATPVVTVHVGWSSKSPVLVDGKRVKLDTAVALVPPAHQDWEDLVELDSHASYVSSKLVIPPSSHTSKEFAKAALTLDLRHTYKSDLRVELLTPQNQVITIHDRKGGGTNDVIGTFPIELPLGTSAAGTWRLIVSDHVGLDTGTLDRWSLSLGNATDRTIASATDTPIFIPDAPANASEAGVATISLEPPPIAQLVGRLGKVVASARHSMSRLELDLAPQLVPPPTRAQVVFVLDASYSMGEEGVRAQLDLVAAYASHVPDAELEIVTYRRHATRTFGSFVPAKQLVAAIANATKHGAFALGNGSHLDEGARLASTLLADRKGPRRVVLATDELVRVALTSELAAAAFRGLSPETIVHVVVPKLDNDDRPALVRRDDAELAVLATSHHGIYADLGGFPAKTIKELAPVVLELVRPTRIENAAVTGFELATDTLHEGDGIRLMVDTEAAPAPDSVTLTGRLWSDPVKRVIPTTRDFSIATAAFVFGADQYEQLDPVEQLAVAMMGRAVSPVTSYVAAEPGTRPSPIGLLHGFGTIGSGRYGSIGFGSGSGAIVRRNPPAWAQLIETASCMTSEKPPAPWSITLVLETTRQEVVEVTPQTPGSMARCLAEVAWNLKLDPAQFPSAHDTFTIELSGPPAS